MNISREQWEQFCKVRDGGQYNMITEWQLAITETSLTKEEWFYITAEYLALEYRFSKPDISSSPIWLIDNLVLVKELLEAEVFFSEDHDNEQLLEAVETAIDFILDPKTRGGL
tara:strand:- start:726 stop:1064 length:339 start_codon:yes stop_codon:yes gene_type:complete